MKIILYILLFLHTSIILADDTINNIYYFTSGPNLVSFNILPENTSIDNIFEDIEYNLISIISEGEISHQVNNEWVGSLTNIEHDKGYWIITSSVSLLDIQGNPTESSAYILYPGANLISYPYTTSQEIEVAIPFYMHNNLHAIIGENSAALFSEGEIFGSLSHFEPNKGYWFLMNALIPFEYNTPIEQNETNNNYRIDDEFDMGYNQSTMQSAFFINQAFYSGQNLEYGDKILAYCNNTNVGGKNWAGTMTDIIAMGNDTYPTTENYCEEMENISITIENENNSSEMYIIGDSQWRNNDISIISISNFQLGDINFSNTLNVTDIIITIDHIIQSTIITNDHKLLLADINFDTTINITDIILMVYLIIE